MGSLVMGKRLSLQTKMDILIDIAVGLEYLHSNNVVHRGELSCSASDTAVLIVPAVADLKPANVLMSEDGRGKR